MFESELKYQIHNIPFTSDSDHNDEDWKFIANEGEIITLYYLNKHIHYGVGNKWIEKYNLYKSFKFTF